MKRTLAGSLVVTALVWGLVGCAAAPTSIDGQTSAQLQHGVVSVATLAAAGDPGGAAVELDKLQADLDAAMERDLVSAARAGRIQRAIDAVRADLEVLVALPVEPLPEPVAVDNSGDDGGGETGGGDDGSGGSDGGSGNVNSGPGNNNGNGNSGPGNNNGKANGSGG